MGKLVPIRSLIVHLCKEANEPTAQFFRVWEAPHTSYTRQPFIDRPASSAKRRRSGKCFLVEKSFAQMSFP